MTGVNDTSWYLQANPRIFVGRIPLRKIPTKSTTLPNLAQTVDGRVLIPGIGAKPDPVVNGTVSNESAASVCAPFPPCNPAGCGDPTIAPIDCEDCNKAATGFTVFGMCFLSLLIVVANFLVIRVILQNRVLRRRHGYIKLSMATSDLLVGLFVIPSAIVNLVSSLYYPQQFDDVTELKQTNSNASVVFGTIAVISVTSSLYNLMLLSLDRLLAIARPLKHRAGRNFSKRSLWLSISLVWIFGISLAIVPAFFPAYFAYEMDLSTFLYIQRLEYNEQDGGGFSSYYITIIMGFPYFSTILFAVMTGFYTWKSLQVRNRLSSRRNISESVMERKCERNKRMKMLQDAYPETALDDTSSTSRGIFKKGTPRHKAKDDHEEKHSWLTWWKSDDVNMSCYNTNNNHFTDSEESRGNSQSPRYQRTRDQMRIVRDIVNPPTAKARKRQLRAKHKTHIRVFRILIAMVVAFSVCILPYIILAQIISNDSSFTCDNAAVPHVVGFALYMLLINSGMNFIIYNLWHPEFRRELMKVFRRDFSRTTTFRRAAGSLFSTSQKVSDSSATYATRTGATDNSSGL